MFDESQNPPVPTVEPVELEVSCPNCAVRYRIVSSLLGRRLSCRHCREVWRAGDTTFTRSGTSSDTAGSRAPSRRRVGTSSSRASDLPLAGDSETQILDTTWVGKRVGRFAVVSLLGRGGMGVVWRAHDDSLKRDVALKILGGGAGFWSATALDLFRQEARAAAQLQHPHVVTVHEVGQDGDSNYLAMELMHGGTLKDVVEATGELSLDQLFSLLVGPARALALAHRRGVIHRDVKPGNLMFDDHQHLKLADFGLAHVNDDPASLHLRDRAVGSLGWVAPEVAAGQAGTTASDIYSFGLCILYGLTARQWIKADSRSKLLSLHQAPPPVDFEKLPAMPDSARAVITTCLAVNPEDRFKDADQLVAALETAVYDIRHPPLTPHKHTARRHPLRFAYLAVGLVCGGLLVAILAAQFVREYMDGVRGHIQGQPASRTTATHESP